MVNTLTRYVTRDEIKMEKFETMVIGPRVVGSVGGHDLPILLLSEYLARHIDHSPGARNSVNVPVSSAAPLQGG